MKRLTPSCPWLWRLQKKNGWFEICLTQMQVEGEKKVWRRERRRCGGVGGVEEVLIAL